MLVQVASRGERFPRFSVQRERLLPPGERKWRNSERLQAQCSLQPLF